MQGSVHAFDPSTGSGSLLLDDGRRVQFDDTAFASSGLRLLRLGQRLTFELAEGGSQGLQAHRLRLNGV